MLMIGPCFYARLLFFVYEDLSIFTNYFFHACRLKHCRWRFCKCVQAQTVVVHASFGDIVATSLLPTSLARLHCPEATVGTATPVEIC